MNNASSINFNPAFGDISVNNGDINLVRNGFRNHGNTLITLFKTNILDYELDPDYGLNLDSFIGQGVSEDLATRIELDIISKIKKFTFIPEMNSIEIFHLIEDNTIHFRIIIPGVDSLNLSYLSEKGFTIE